MLLSSILVIFSLNGRRSQFCRMPVICFGVGFGGREAEMVCLLLGLHILVLLGAI